MSLTLRRCIIGVTASAAMLMASAAPALASPSHHAAAVKRFQVHGIVLAVHGNKVKVLSSVAKVGSKTARNRVVTLTMTPGTHKTAKPRVRHTGRRAAALRTEVAAGPAVLAAGQDLVAAGTLAPNGALVASTETSTVLAAEALVGKVTSVSADGSTFTVASHDQVDGDHAAHDNGEGTVVSAAGAKIIGSPVAAGQYVVVLGEADDSDMLAAAVYTFGAPPALAVGQVTASNSDSRTVTIDAQGSEHDGQEDGDNEDGSTPSINVDASHADVVLNGVLPTPSTSAPAFPTVGDEVLAVGAAGSTPDALTATLVFVFNQADNGSVDDNEKDQEGQHGENGDS
ncbi:MAG: hypothetical protein NVSMB55_10880 [Mycobacteriales bacterium]